MSIVGDNTPSDADLVAYLDGKMAEETREALRAQIASDTKLQDRLALLARGGRPFRQAFDILLDHAPRERLNAILTVLPVTKPTPDRRTLGGRARRIVTVAAGILLFFTGMAVDQLAPLGPPE